MCDCDRALELISLRLDGALLPEEAGELEEHLEHCPPCRSLAQELEQNPDVRYCPHGRPVYIILRRRDIERQFGRV